MRKNKKKAGQIGFAEILILLIFLTGFGTLAYPTVSDLWNRYRNSQLIAGYDEAVEGISGEEYDRMLKEAEEYNRKHTVNSIIDTFYKENEYVLTHPYDGYLNPRGDGIMGYLSIPKIHADITIYHGTGADTLEQGVGHVEGTSLPIGGASTHAVIAGHRGLPTARLFTDLDQMEEGDLFYLHILSEVLAYQTDQILTVEPDEPEALAIEEGKDYVTLLTCTPYGVNTHRLLIRGIRTENIPEQEDTDAVIHTVFRDKRGLLMILGLAVFVVILIGMLKRRQRPRSKLRASDL